MTLLPFTRTGFLQIFSAYNTAIWPFQVVATALGLTAIAFLFWRTNWSDRAIATILCTFWSITGIGYHWMHFSAINNAAYFFGVLFLMSALVFLIEGAIRDRMRFAVTSGFRGCSAALLIVYAIAAYPVIGLIATHPYPETPLFGVTPCPTTIFTLGLLLLVRHPRPWLLAAIPLFWSVIGGSAAFLLGVPQDLGLLAAAALFVAASLFRPAEAAR